MTEKKQKKEKVLIETRAPQRRGIFDNLGKDRQKVKHPFNEIINLPSHYETTTEEAQPPNSPNLTNIANPTNQQDIDNLTNTTNVTNPTNFSILTSPVSPIRDYTKVANSIAREAVPERLFRGMSKNTYDALYLRTRGAIKPVRKIRATKSDLIRWAGVSDVTIDKHIKQLKAVGLLRVEFIIGSHEGNWYEVFIPEEIKVNSLDDPTNLTNPSQPNIVGSQITNSVGGDREGEVVENIDENSIPKTSYKTNTEDVEGFTNFIKIFQAANEEITGKKLTKTDEKHLANLAELLVLELKIAARRTESVSSVPAFLTEVLRRKLRNLPLSRKSPKAKPDLVGKSEKDDYEVKALNSEEREAALTQLQEFAEDDFLSEFKKWYVEEDWAWLMEHLNK